MNTEIILGASSILAAVALPARRLVGFDGNLCAANAKARGVSAVATAAGQMCPLNISGELLVEAGAAIARGAALISDATGRAVTAGATPVINGYAVDAASAAGQFIRVSFV